MSFIREGGTWFTIPILLMGISTLLLFGFALIQSFQGKEISRKAIDAILFLGSFAFIFGILGQIIGFYQAAGVIQETPEISSAVIWGGFRVSLISPIMGFVTLLISSILWFIVKPKK